MYTQACTRSSSLCKRKTDVPRAQQLTTHGRTQDEAKREAKCQKAEATCLPSQASESIVGIADWNPLCTTSWGGINRASVEARYIRFTRRLAFLVDEFTKVGFRYLSARRRLGFWYPIPMLTTNPSSTIRLMCSR